MITKPLKIDQSLDKGKAKKGKANNKWWHHQTLKQLNNNYSTTSEILKVCYKIHQFNLIITKNSNLRPLWPLSNCYNRELKSQFYSNKISNLVNLNHKLMLIKCYYQCNLLKINNYSNKSKFNNNNNKYNNNNKDLQSNHQWTNNKN